jgi:hypothetical protein
LSIIEREEEKGGEGRKNGGEGRKNGDIYVLS